MRKTLRLLPLMFLAGCDINLWPEISVPEPAQQAISSGLETVKEVGKAYYEDTMKETVDTAIMAVQEQAETVKQETQKAIQDAKDQYNTAIEQINQDIQKQADEAKDQINKLKI